MIEIVLKNDVSKLGFRGDILKVKSGYFHNYLFPRNLAVKADANAKKEALTLQKKQVMKKEQVAANAKAIASQLANVVLQFNEPTTEKGHLYGSVDEKAIVEALKMQAKVDIDKSHIKMESHIKELGDYEVSVVLNEETEALIKLKIEAKN